MNSVDIAIEQNYRAWECGEPSEDTCSRCDGELEGEFYIPSRECKGTVEPVCAECHAEYERWKDA